MPNEGDNDLFFALKGAGSNFGIVTQFLYRIYPFPETRPIAMPVYLRSIYDFVKLQKIAETGQYQISVYRIQHFRRPTGGWLSNTRHLSRVHFHRASRDRLGYEPVVVMFTALQTSATATGLSGVQRALRRVRLSTAYPSLFQVDRFLTWQWGIDRSGNNDPTFRSYDYLFYSRQERRRQGRRAFVSASLTSASSPWAFEEIAFNDATFDLRSSILLPNPDLGCDACFWHVTLWTSAYHRVQFFANSRTSSSSSSRSNTLWSFELVCLYDPRNRLRARRCKDLVDRARFRLNEATNVRLSEPLHQSYNTPSCHNLPNERPFAQRYVL